MHTKATVAVIAALTLGATACGSSGPLTSAQLTKQANAICKQRSARMAVVMKQHKKDFRGVVAAGAPVYSKAAGDLHALKPPGSARAAYTHFVAIQESFAKQLKTAASTGKLDGASSAERTRSEELARVTEQLGIASCK